MMRYNRINFVDYTAINLNLQKTNNDHHTWGHLQDINKIACFGPLVGLILPSLKHNILCTQQSGFGL